MIRNLFTVIMLICLAMLQSGCAYVSAIPVDPDSNISGIRIYDVKPLLVVSGTSVDVVLVPNYNRAYALRFGSFLAKHDFEADFQNGFISKVHSNQDTTSVALALVNIIHEAIKTGNPIRDAFSAKADGGSVNRFGVYDIIFDNDGNLIELRPLISDRTLIRTPANSTMSAPPPVNEKKIDLK